MTTSRRLFFALFALLLVTGCADANLAENNADLCNRDLSGFFLGVWHGFIAPFSLIGSLFDSQIAVYDICNIGGWYDFGFCLGIGALTSGSHQAASTATGESEAGGGE